MSVYKGLFVFCGAVLTAGMSFAFELVGPKGTATVVVPEQAEPSTLLAMQELTNYVARITGNVLEVRKVGVENRCRCRMDAPSIVIGTLGTLGDEIPAAARKALEATENPEASWTGTSDGTLWIIGKEDVSELYATYRFLDAKLGVRWFKAATKEDPGDYVPEVKVKGQGQGQDW